MTIRTKKKIHSLRNDAYDLIESWIYAIADSTVDEDSFEYVLSSLCEELNKLKQNKEVIVYTKKRMRRIKKILDKAIYSEDVFKNIRSILKVFGIN